MSRYKIYSYLIDQPEDLIDATGDGRVNSTRSGFYGSVAFKKTWGNYFSYPNFFAQLRAVFTTEFLATMRFSNQNPFVALKERFKWSTYPSFFMNVRLLNYSKTTWIGQEAASKTWIEQPDVR
jgi:hypothetical protein